MEIGLQTCRVADGGRSSSSMLPQTQRVSPVLHGMILVAIMGSIFATPQASAAQFSGQIQSYGNLTVRMLSAAKARKSPEPPQAQRNTPTTQAVIKPAGTTGGVGATLSPVSQVMAEGPTAGPAGLIIPFVTPACEPTDGNAGIIVLYEDYKEFAILWGSGLKSPVQWGYWTINDDIGTHQFSVACYDSGLQSLEGSLFFVFPAPWEETMPSEIWKDSGFAYQITAPSMPTELPYEHAGPGYILTTPSGAPAGPSPCPTIDATPWQTARISFYSWQKEEWLRPEEYYSLQSSDVSNLPLLPLEIPPGAERGEQLGVSVECYRPREYPEAEEVGFTFGMTDVNLDEPAGGSLRQRELAAGGWNLAEWCVNCLLRKYISFGYPVDGPTGNFWHSFTDFDIPGRGLPLNLTRTYNSMLATSDGPFGYGWSFLYGMSLDFADATEVQVNQENGAQVTFTEQSDGSYVAAPRVTAQLVHNGDGTWTFTRHAREIFTFNAAGRLTKGSELNGNVTSLAYNSDGYLDSVTDPSGRTLTFTYHGSHITSATDPLGREVRYSYDEAGNLTNVTDARGNDTRFTYDSNHRLLTMRVPNQEPAKPGSTEAVVRNVYDSQGRVISQTDQRGNKTIFAYSGEPLGPVGGTTTITDPRGNVTTQEYRFGELVSETKGGGTEDAATWTFAYDPSTLGMTEITDPDGNTTANTFDAEGNLLTTTDPLGNTTTYTYDAHNDITSDTDPRGTTTTYYYDDAGNVVKKTTPLDETGETAQTTYSYEGFPGEITAVTDPDGHTIHFGYDSAGNCTSVVDSDGNETTYTYNGDGEETAMVSPAGNKAGGSPAAHTTSFAYNADGELTDETDQLGHTTSYTYDGNGNRISVTDSNGHTTHQTYDADNELTEVERPNGSILKTDWDAAGNIIAQIDAAGHKTVYAYNRLNRLTSVTNPDGQTTSYVYDPAGYKSEAINAEGKTTYYYYDADGELTGVGYSDYAPSVRQNYDEDGNRVRLEDETGVSTFSYDSLNRMTSATDGSGNTVNYEYDLTGNLMKLTYPNGHSVTRSYDAVGNVTGVTDWLGHTSHFSYDDDSNLKEEQYANGVTTQLGYDNADQLNSITDSNGGGRLASFTYARDAVGQVTNEETENGDSAATAYSRNSLDQLTAANSMPYGYDAADNPTTFGAETTQYFDPANELTSAVGPWDIPETASEPPEEGAPSPSPSPTPDPSSGAGSGPETGGGLRTTQPLPAISQRAASPRVDAVATAKVRKPGTLVSQPVRTSHAHGLILVFVSAADRRQRVSKVSGGGLRWKPLAQQDDYSGAAEIWQAKATKPLRSRVVIHLRRKTRSATAAVAAFGNTAYVVGHVTSHGHGSQPTSQPQAPAGSVLWGVGHAIGQSQAAHTAANQRIVSQFFNKRARVAGWVQSTTASASSSKLSDNTSASRWVLLSIVIASRAAQSATASSATLPSSSAEVGAPSTDRSGAVANRGTASSRAAKSSNVAAAAEELVTRNFAYNQRGDRIREEISGGPTRTLTYNQADRLIGVDDNVTYTYNGDGLRTSKTVNGISTHFAWNQAEALPELLQAGSMFYIYGPEGRPIEQIEGSLVTYLQKDQQGSIRLLTNASGSAVGRYDYDAWGNVLKHTGSTASNLQYDGQYTDAETGYQYLRARYYDSSTGQWLSRDPLVSITEAAYAFGGNDPVDGGDPSGAWTVCFGVCIAHDAKNGWGIGIGTPGFNPTDNPHIGFGKPGLGGELITYSSGALTASGGGCVFICLVPSWTARPTKPAPPRCVQTCDINQQEYQMIVLKALNAKAVALQQNLATDAPGTPTYCAAQTSLDKVNSQRTALLEQLQQEQYER